MIKELKNKFNSILSLIWLITIIVTGYITFKKFPFDLLNFSNIQYNYLIVGLFTGVLSSLPIVFVLKDVLLKDNTNANISAFILTFLPAIAKYIPGKIWSVVGFIAQAQKLTGIPKKSAGFFLLYIQIIGVMTSGILVMIGLLFYDFIKPLKGQYYFNAAAVLVLLSSIIAIIVYKRISSNFSEIIKYKQIFLHIFIFSIQKLLKGLALVIFLSSFVSVRGHYIEIIISFIVASQIGIIAFFAPAGIGVTEGAYVLLLSNYFSVEIALQFAIAARLLQTLIDFILAGIAYGVKNFVRQDDL